MSMSIIRGSFAPADHRQHQSAGTDPILKLHRKLRAAVLRWEPAQAEVDQIEFSIPNEICGTAAEAPLLEAAGYAGANVREKRLRIGMDRIEQKMADTVPTTLPGVLALTRVAVENYLHREQIDRQMLARIVEALQAMPQSLAIAILLALAEKARVAYEDADNCSWIPRGPGMLAAMIIALETMMQEPAPDAAKAA
jgi:hypothetical protein